MIDVLDRSVTPAEQRRKEAELQRRAMNWIAATDKLCDGNTDFAEWLYGVMDDLGLWDRPETTLSEFGQGFRAAANRIRNRMLEAPKAVNLFVSLTKRHLTDRHRAFVNDRNKNKTTITET